MDWSRVPLLLVTAALLISGVLQNELGTANQAMLSVGFVCLGAWATIEIQTWYQRMRRSWERDEPLPGDPPDSGPKPDA